MIRSRCSASSVGVMLAGLPNLSSSRSTLSKKPGASRERLAAREGRAARRVAATRPALTAAKNPRARRGLRTNAGITAGRQIGERWSSARRSRSRCSRSRCSATRRSRSRCSAARCVRSMCSSSARTTSLRNGATSPLGSASRRKSPAPSARAAAMMVAALGRSGFATVPPSNHGGCMKAKAHANHALGLCKPLSALLCLATWTLTSRA